MPWIAAGAAVGGALLSNAGSRGAADAQGRASQAAIDEQRRQFDLTQERQLPFHQAGVAALGQLSNAQFRAPTQAEVLNDPGYAFGLSQGRDALESSAAAHGNLYSGNTLKKLLEYGTNYGTSKYNDAFDRARSVFNTNLNNQSNLANLGAGAAAQLQNAGTNFAKNTGSLLTRNASAQGAAGITQANNLQDLLNQGVSIGKNAGWFGGGGGDSAVKAADGGPVMVMEDGRMIPKVGTRSARPMAGGAQSNSLRMVLDKEPTDLLPVSPVGASGVQKYALPASAAPTMVMEDGRMVPQVGTRSAMPSASGGQMSREAVLQALTAVQAGAAQPPMQKTGIAALPVNPITNPSGLRKLQIMEAERAAGLGYNMGGGVCPPGSRQNYDSGGSVHGPGGPRDDLIPAWLSNGEYVLPADVVTNMGGGSNMLGMQHLNRLRAALRS